MSWAAGGLLHWLAVQLLYSAILAASLMIALRVLRVRAPLVREAAWWLVILRLVVAPGWWTPVSLRALLEPWLVVAAPAPRGNVLVATGATVGGGLAPGPPAAPWQLGLGLAWVVVASLSCLLLLRRMAHYRRICRRAAAVEAPELCELVEEWRARLGVRRRVRLVSAGGSGSPFTTGSWRPTIFLPVEVVGWERAAVEPVIAHEMVHVARWDETRMLLANLVRCVHFFNPVAWLAVLELGQAREERCDELVVASGRVSVRDYGRTLARILRLSRGVAPAVDVVAGLVERKEGMKMRALSIVSRAASRPSRPWLVSLGFVLAAALLVPMAPAAGDGGRAGTSAAAAAPPALQLKGWVNVGLARLDEPVQRLPLPVDPQEPAYTAAAIAAGTTGMVKLAVTVAEDGRVEQVDVLQGLRDGLSEAAVAAVRGWQFRPAQDGGRAVECRFMVFAEFRLVDASPRPLDGELVAELAPLLPAGVTLTGITTDGAMLHLDGVAAAPDQVGELLGHLEGADGFAHPELESIARDDVGFRFQLRCEKKP